MSKASDTAEAALAAGQRRYAIDHVAAAARDGDADAMTVLAHWLLIGDPVPRDLAGALRLLEAAATHGHEQASLTAAALIANGSGTAPDWPRALKILQHAAPRLGGTAQEHLDLLGRMAIDGDGKPSTLPEPEVLGSKPQVRVWRGLLSPEECAHLATSVLDLLAPSMVVDPQSGRQVAHPVRRSSAAVIGPTRETLPIQAIQRRIAAITDTDTRQGEPLAVLHYAPGQQYLPHVDTLPGETNQRIVTALIYLNTDYEGGATHFPANGVTVRGGLGDVAIFNNVLPDGSPDPASRHAGLPIQRGAKWLATRWIRRKPLDIWTASG